MDGRPQVTESTAASTYTGRLSCQDRAAAKKCFYKEPGHVLLQCPVKAELLKLRNKSGVAAQATTSRSETADETSSSTSGDANLPASEYTAAWSAKPQSSRQGVWCVNSGSTHHICDQHTALVNTRKCNLTVSIADRRRVTATEVGDAPLMIFHREKPAVRVILTNVYRLPDESHNLVSVNQLLKRGILVNFTETAATLRTPPNPNGQVVNDVVADWDGQVWSLKTQSAQHRSAAGASATLIQWHEGLGYVNPDDIMCIHNHGFAEKVEVSSVTPLPCEACRIGKQSTGRGR